MSDRLTYNQKMRLLSSTASGGDKDRLPDWKREQDRLLPVSEFVNMWAEFRKLQPVLDDKTSIILGVSSNVPTCEAGVFRYEVEQGRKVHMLAGDMAAIDPHYAVDLLHDLIDKNHTFDFFRWDADNLPIPDASVDVLIDRRGWLWYACSQDVGVTGMKHILDSYSRKLVADGVLLVDADGGSSSGFHEWSTVEYVKFKNGKNFWESSYVQELFNVSYVGENRSRTMVMKKK